MKQDFCCRQCNFMETFEARSLIETNIKARGAEWLLGGVGQPWCPLCNLAWHMDEAVRIQALLLPGDKIGWLEIMDIK